MSKELDGIPPDPLKHCGVYRKEGCTHVDGFLCDTRTCDILARWHRRQYDRIMRDAKHV